MMKSFDTWPFLVSCNKYLEYRTIVAPSFMCEARISSILAKAVEGDLTEPGTALYREINNSNVGNLTLIFRILEATASDIGTEGNEVLKDSFGRAIYLIEGIVFIDLITNSVVTEENFKLLHKQLMNYYRNFWNCTTTNPAIHSEPFDLQVDSSLAESLKYKRLKEYTVSSKRQDLINPTKLVKKSETWQCVFTGMFNGRISSLNFFPQGSFLAVKYDQKISIYKLNEPITKVCEVLGSPIFTGGSPTPVTVSSNGELIASAIIESIDQNVVKIWNCNTKVGKSLYGHSLSCFGRVFAVAFTPDSQILASGGSDKNIKLWDIPSETELGILSGHSSAVKSIVISADGQTLVSGDAEGIIKFWNLKSRKERSSIKLHSLSINSLFLSPNNQMLVSGSDDCSIKLLNVKTGGKEIFVIREHSAPVNSVAFSPDGQMLASGGDDHQIHLWNVKNKQKIQTLSEHRKEITSIKFSPDGQTLASGSKDFQLKLWKV